MATPNLMEFKQLAQTFTEFYYKTFDGYRQDLMGLFCDVSIMTFENETLMGREQIMKKLAGLPFKQVQHVVTTVDGQPTVDNGVLITVLGQLKTDDDPPHSFSEVFHLKKPTPTDNYVILNSFFRLAIHNM